MDENTPAVTPQAATPAPSKKAKRHKKRARTSMPAPKAPASSPKSAGVAPASGYGILIAVYVVLGLLVIATSVLVGYQWGKSAALRGTGSGDLGGKGAVGSIQIIEYSDFECPFCSRVAPTITQLKQQYGDKIEIVYKHYPLESIHPNALGASIASECARDQGKFWEYHDKLFANQQALDIPSLKRYAQELGLNTGKFDKCLDGKETEARVRADIAEAEGRGVSGTPSFWIKDELVVGALPIATFQQKIDEKLSGKAAAPQAPTQPTAPTQPSAPVDVEAGANIKGNADAPVLIVEFTDYQCPFCKRHYEQSEGQIVKNYVETGKARLAVRHFPLGFHAQAQKAAEAAECAAEQGKFWEMHNTLFTKGSGDGTGLAVADLKQYAADLKLDTAKFNTCLDSGKTAAKVQQDMADGQAAGVSGTPSFVINGKLVVGAQPYSTFASTIDAAIAG